MKTTLLDPKQQIKKQYMEQKNKLKSIKTGVRLNTPAHKVFKHAKDYTRKEKYKSILKEDYYV